MKLTNAEKIARAKAKMAAWGIEPITSRAWKPAAAYLAPEKPHEQAAPATVTPIRKRK